MDKFWSDLPQEEKERYRKDKEAQEAKEAKEAKENEEATEAKENEEMTKSEYRAYNFAAQEPSKGSTVEDPHKKMKDEIDRKLKEKDKLLDEQFANPKYAKEWER